MPQRVSWRNLVPGLIALAAVIGAAAAVMAFGGVGRIRGDKTRLYVRADQARGLMTGSDVWLAGQKVGVVEGVTFLPPDADSGGRVVIAVSVKTSAAEAIRRDSRARVRSGGSVIGPMVVYVEGGTPASPRAA